MGIESTKNKIDYAGIGNFECIDDKIDKAWIVEDELTIMKQLGLELR
jgi:predicted ester cyclase